MTYNVRVINGYDPYNGQFQIDAKNAVAAIRSVTNLPVTHRWRGVAHAEIPGKLLAGKPVFYRAEPAYWQRTRLANTISPLIPR